MAGGRSTRMGQDKALVEFRGAPMIEHMSTAVAGAGLEALIVGRNDAVSGLRAVDDLPNIGGGPSVGLLSAFEASPPSDIFLVAVDQPLLRSATIKSLLDVPGDIVVPMAGGHPQVTCALYRHAVHTTLADLVGTGVLKLRRLLDAVDTTYVEERTWSTWGEDGRSWLSLDTPQAVRDAEDLR